MKRVILASTAVLGVATLLAIGGLNGEHNLPLVDEYGNVVGTWGGESAGVVDTGRWDLPPDRVAYDCPQPTPSACEQR